MKSYVDNVDVPMGAHDSAQDDIMIFLPDSNGHKTSKIQKIIRAFKLLDLQIEIASNLKIVDFFVVTLILNNGTFKLF